MMLSPMDKRASRLVWPSGLVARGYKHGAEVVGDLVEAVVGARLPAAAIGATPLELVWVVWVPAPLWPIVAVVVALTRVPCVQGHDVTLTASDSK